MIDTLLGVVTAAVNNQPRSRQRLIGPSEIGTPCDRCLGHKLAGTAKTPDLSGDWLPYIGTAVHARLDEVFTNASLALAAEGAPARWMSECRVDVGEIDGEVISGTADLFDVLTGTVIDFKIVGESTLRAAKQGPSATYRTQIHAYGRGWVRAGYQVNKVAIWYLPRNSRSLRAGHYHEEDYDESIVTAALARCEAYTAAMRALGKDQFLRQLTRAGCFDCTRYPLFPGEQTASTTPDMINDL